VAWTKGRTGGKEGGMEEGKGMSFPLKQGKGGRREVGPWSSLRCMSREGRKERGNERGEEEGWKGG